MDAQDAGNGRATLALGDELDGSAAAAFQFSGGSKWSAHTQLYAQTYQWVHYRDWTQ
jgi:hypothetical protein